MLKIYIVRHGQDEDNLAGILNGRRNQPLTELGRSQAAKLATFILSNGLKFDKIFSSPLIRARETARIIAQALNFNNLEIDNRLLERDFGVMTGKKVSEIVDLCAPDILETETATYFFHAEGAETFPDLVNRANLLLSDIMASNEEGDILLVGHGDFGKMIYAAYYDLPYLEVLSEFHFGNSELVLLSKEIKSKEAQIFKTEQSNL